MIVVLTKDDMVQSKKDERPITLDHFLNKDLGETIQRAKLVLIHHVGLNFEVLKNNNGSIGQIVTREQLADLIKDI